MKIKIILMIISCYLTQTTAKCPSVEVMLPCNCEYNAYIYCGGNDYYNLKNIFMSISSALTDDEKHFKRFHFNNTAINELEINVFYDITFDTIEIDSAYNLTQINTLAFLSTNCFVKSFYLRHTPYGNITDGNNIFNAINCMTNIETVEIWNTSITVIPPNAFAVLKKLKILSMPNNTITSIGDHAFYGLTNLALLDLAYNPIEHISEYALSLRNSDTIIRLRYIDNMRLQNQLVMKLFDMDSNANVSRYRTKGVMLRSL